MSWPASAPVSPSPLSRPLAAPVAPLSSGRPETRAPALRKPSLWPLARPNLCAPSQVAQTKARRLSLSLSLSLGRRCSRLRYLICATSSGSRAQLDTRDELPAALPLGTGFSQTCARNSSSGAPTLDGLLGELEPKLKPRAQLKLPAATGGSGEPPVRQSSLAQFHSLLPKRNREPTNRLRTLCGRGAAAAATSAAKPAQTQTIFVAPPPNCGRQQKGVQFASGVELSSASLRPMCAFLARFRLP